MDALEKIDCGILKYDKFIIDFIWNEKAISPIKLNSYILAKNIYLNQILIAQNRIHQAYNEKFLNVTTELDTECKSNPSVLSEEYLAKLIEQVDFERKIEFEINEIKCFNLAISLQNQQKRDYSIFFRNLKKLPIKISQLLFTTLFNRFNEKMNLINDFVTVNNQALGNIEERIRLCFQNEIISEEELKILEI